MNKKHLSIRSRIALGIFAAMSIQTAVCAEDRAFPVFKCLDKTWVKPDEPVQNQAWIRFLGVGRSPQQKQAEALAEGMTLSKLQKTCKVVPKTAKTVNRCAHRVGEDFWAYTQVSVRKEDCNPNTRQNSSTNAWHTTLRSYNSSLDQLKKEASLSPQPKTDTSVTPPHDILVARSRYAINSGDPLSARSPTEKLCQNGYADHCLELGYLDLAQGNRKEVNKFFGIACEVEVLDGCVASGAIENQEGKPEAAKSLFRKACRANVLLGCSYLGMMMNKEANITGAKRLYRYACSGEEMMGCFNLGKHAQSEGDPQEARRFFAKACDLGDPGGCFAAGNILENALKLADARIFYQKACDLDDREACMNLTDLLLESGKASESRQLKNAICSRGEPGLCDLIQRTQNKFHRPD